ncbi:hypothetical protein THAOC_37899 [Thalassiosira oceanica]|uniref:Uncharacterized protein n=1 Tax=Thalassiosira oceanica TaxID=159749 RepID=K0QY41_THAOC|nr:hypothetical protein THAOC_37899 [Thalassiosira oceanica]|eukprot:EJK43638.1 hypothetical protein THAOC_37899 [Thalassiosira oceanica]
MSELNHLRKKPPDDGGLLLDTKDRRHKMESEECGVIFYIGPEETSQQASKHGVKLLDDLSMQPRKKGSVWQRKVVNGNRYACKSKLCVKIFIVMQRLKMHGKRQSVSECTEGQIKPKTFYTSHKGHCQCNVFGQVPEDVVAPSSMTEVLCSSVAVQRPFAHLYSWSGGQHTAAVRETKDDERGSWERMWIRRIGRNRIKKLTRAEFMWM